MATFLGATSMTNPTGWLAAARGPIAVLALAFGFVGNVMAEAYDFNRIVSGGGGGGGSDPAKKRIVESRGQHICLDVKERPGNQVMFTIWSTIPEPNARVQTINFDTGKHANLITSITVVFQSPGPKAKVIPSSTTASSRGSRTSFQVLLPYEYSGGRSRGGLGPGNVIMISATLGPGQTFANLMNALHEGLNPATEAYGLHIWVVGHYFLGGPPPGVGSIQDDATFTLRGPGPQCRR